MQFSFAHSDDASFDEVFDDDHKVRPHWKRVIAALESSDNELFEQIQNEIDWLLEHNGVTYNVYNKPDNEGRKWNLDPIPFVISQKDWSEVSRGLQQRAKLFNAIFKDLYTEQKLIKEGIVPAEIIYANQNFLAEVANFDDHDYYTLQLYAADIARAPDGKFWVINDKTQSPSGLGYTIENRLTMNAVSKEIYPQIKIKKLYSFVEKYKKLLASLNMDKDKPLTALLTPGPFNETYFEHSLLSSFLDLTLVQGDDLLVKNNRVWLRTLDGLQRVDTIIRRVDEDFCDPLELNHNSQLGIAGLVDALRQNSVSMINPIGVGILENVGLNPFMENIAEFFFNEKLILPQIATWWCGQEKERDFVLKNLDNLIIKAVHLSGKEVYSPKRLTEQERAALIEKIGKNPGNYVGQEYINFSSAPSLDNGTITNRKAVIRAFTIREEDEYNVMAGGLVRVASSDDALSVSNQKGGISKDLWILGSVDEKVPVSILDGNKFTAQEDYIPTKRAENFFWLGRYLARAIFTSRMLRFTIKNSISMGRMESDTNDEIQKLLNVSLTHLTMTYPGFLSEKKLVDTKEYFSIVSDNERAGSLAFTLVMLENTNIYIKNMLTMDAWKLSEKIARDMKLFASGKSRHSRNAVNFLENLLVYLMAYKELIDESLFIEQGSYIYNIGYQLESSLLLISKVRSLLCVKQEKITQYDVLIAVLNSYESFNAYRTLYKSSVEIESVVDFLIFNEKYPKSLVANVHDLLDAMKLLPSKVDDSAFNTFEKAIFEAYSMLKLNSSGSVLKSSKNSLVYDTFDSFLSDLSEKLVEAADELTKAYFA